MNNLALEIGSIVTIKDCRNFKGFQGVVMDTKSDLDPKEGPTAVFFDTEVPDFYFINDEAKFVLPTPDNYRECSRVICFKPENDDIEKTAYTQSEQKDNSILVN